MELPRLFRTSKANVLNHWISLVEDFQYSPAEFYDAIEKELEARQVPGLQLSQIEFAEGGLLSDKRVYLRMVRERLVFDVCAAPFGRSFFFSCRMAEIPVQLKLTQIIALAAVMGFLLFAATKYLGLILGTIVIAGLLVALVWIMRNVVAAGLSDLDATLMRSSLIGPIYELWIRKETYYRADTRLMYLDTVPHVVKKLAEEVASAKGVKLVRQYEQAPILGELYKPVVPRTEIVASK